MIMDYMRVLRYVIELPRELLFRNVSNRAGSIQYVVLLCRCLKIYSLFTLILFSTGKYFSLISLKIVNVKKIHWIHFFIYDLYIRENGKMGIKEKLISQTLVCDLGLSKQNKIKSWTSYKLRTWNTKRNNTLTKRQDDYVSIMWHTSLILCRRR